MPLHGRGPRRVLAESVLHAVELVPWFGVGRKRGRRGQWLQRLRSGVGRVGGAQRWQGLVTVGQRLGVRAEPPATAEDVRRHHHRAHVCLERVRHPPVRVPEESRRRVARLALCEHVLRVADGAVVVWHARVEERQRSTGVVEPSATTESALLQRKQKTKSASPAERAEEQNVPTQTDSSTLVNE